MTADINSLHTCAALAYFHTWSLTHTHTQAAVKPPPEIVSHPLSLRMDQSRNFFDRPGKHSVYRSRIWRIWSKSGTISLFAARQKRGGCCAKNRCTDWPSSQRRGGLALSTSSGSPRPQQRSGETRASRRSAGPGEIGKKQTYRCSEITSYL